VTNLGARFFAHELRRARTAAGLTQAQLAALVNYSASHIAMIETGERIPKRDLAERCDAALGLNGLLVRVFDELVLTQPSVDAWFTPWVTHEREATRLHLFENFVVPGLLQTEGYALALTGDKAAAATRLERQQILGGEHPPEVRAIIDEYVLRRPIGGPDVMREQLVHLMNLPATVRVQVLPERAETYAGVDGPFALATVDGREYVYVHTPAQGFVLDSPDAIAKIKDRRDILGAEALPLGQSRALILEAAEEWKRQIAPPM